MEAPTTFQYLGDSRPVDIVQAHPLTWTALEASGALNKRPPKQFTLEVRCDVLAESGGTEQRGILFQKAQFPFYALVAGGVLPPDLVHDGIALLDRNIYAHHASQATPEGDEAGVILRRLAERRVSISPYVVLYELPADVEPTQAGLAAEWQRKKMQLAAIAPGLPTLNTFDSDPAALLAERLEWDQRTKHEAEFLRNSSSLFSRSLPRHQRTKAANQLLRNFGCTGLSGNSTFLLHASLGAIYGSGPAQRVLKVKPGSQTEDLLNGLWDLRHLEVLAFLVGLDRRGVLLTHDKSLTALWSLLAPRSFRSESGRVGVRPQMRPQLVPAMSSADFTGLQEQVERAFKTGANINTVLQDCGE